MKSADAFPARRSLVVPFFSSRLPTLIFVFHLPMKAGNQPGCGLSSVVGSIRYRKYSPITSVHFIGSQLFVRQLGCTLLHQIVCLPILQEGTWRYCAHE